VLNAHAAVARGGSDQSQVAQVLGHWERLIVRLSRLTMTAARPQIRTISRALVERGERELSSIVAIAVRSLEHTTLGRDG
jgi:hypothetical protein